jgi:serine/threonine-protein kinase RsbW
MRPDPSEACGATLDFLTGRGAVPGILREVAALLRKRGYAREMVEDGVIVLAEVLNNVEEHAYSGRAGQPVRVELSLSASALDVVVRDGGAPLPEGPLPGAMMPRCEGDAPEHWPEGGFGWAIVRRLAVGLSYRCDADGNVLRFSIVPGQAVR